MLVSDLWCLFVILCVLSVVVRWVCCVLVCFALGYLWSVGLASFRCVVVCCPCCVYFICNMRSIGSLLLVEYTVVCIFHRVVCYAWCWYL